MQRHTHTAQIYTQTYHKYKYIHIHTTHVCTQTKHTTDPYTSTSHTYIHRAIHEHICTYILQMHTQAYYNLTNTHTPHTCIHANNAHTHKHAHKTHTTQIHIHTLGRNCRKESGDFLDPDQEGYNPSTTCSFAAESISAAAEARGDSHTWLQTNI